MTDKERIVAYIDKLILVFENAQEQIKSRLNG